MNPTIRKLLSQVYELEGLLHTVDTHSGDTDEMVFEMIHAKSKSISTLAQQVEPGIFTESPALPIEPPQAPATTQMTGTEGSDEEDYDPEEAVDGPQPGDTTASPEPQSKDEQPAEFEEFIDTADNASLHDSDEDVKEIWTSDYQEPDASTTPIPDEPQDDSENNYAEEGEAPTDDDDSQEPITLDAALQRNLSKDLSKAFTINDQFRFRRELFGNSMVEWTETLNLVEAMKSYSEAEDYFFGDLSWDKESEEVKDFMTIIRNHFL